MWARNGTTRNGAPQVAAPVEIACRWLGSTNFNRRGMGASSDGQGMVLVDRVIPVGSLIFQGLLSEATGSFEPVFEVGRASKIVARRFDVHSIELGALTSNPVVAVNGDYIVHTLSLKWVRTLSYSGVHQDVIDEIADGDIVQITGRTATGTALLSALNVAGDFDVLDETTLDLTGSGYRVGDTLTIINFGQPV